MWKTLTVGMFDTVLVLDELSELRCANGHALQSFQTKDLDDPSMTTYLVRHGRLYRAQDTHGRSRAESDPSSWRFEADGAIHEQRFTLSEVHGPLVVNVYCSCKACEPVLIRTPEAGLFGDIVSEHALLVDFRLAFRPNEPIYVERTSGTREDLKRELGSRGAYVLRDDEPLAVAHREIVRARRRADEHGPRRRRRF